MMLPKYLTADILSGQVYTVLAVIWYWRLLGGNGQALVLSGLITRPVHTSFLLDQTGHELQWFTKLSQRENVTSIFEISKQNNVQLNTTDSCLLKLYSSTNQCQHWTMDDDRTQLCRTPVEIGNHAAYLPLTWTQLLFHYRVLLPMTSLPRDV